MTLQRRRTGDGNWVNTLVITYVITSILIISGMMLDFALYLSDNVPIGSYLFYLLIDIIDGLVYLMRWDMSLVLLVFPLCIMCLLLPTEDVSDEKRNGY